MADSGILSLVLIEDCEDDVEIFKIHLRKYRSLKLLGVAPTLEDGLNLVRTLSPQLLLVDLSLPGARGVEIVFKVVAQFPDLAVVVMTGAAYDNEFGFLITKAGVQDFICKDDLIKANLEKILFLAYNRQLLACELKQKSSFKSEVLSNMYHELLTPVKGVVKMTSLLMESSLTPEQFKLVESISQSSEVMNTLLKNTLKLAQLDSGKVEHKSTT